MPNKVNLEEIDTQSVARATRSGRQLVIPTPSRSRRGSPLTPSLSNQGLPIQSNAERPHENSTTIAPGKKQKVVAPDLEDSSERMDADEIPTKDGFLATVNDIKVNTTADTDNPAPGAQSFPQPSSQQRQHPQSATVGGDPAVRNESSQSGTDSAAVQVQQQGTPPASADPPTHSYVLQSTEPGVSVEQPGSTAAEPRNATVPQATVTSASRMPASGDLAARDATPSVVPSAADLGVNRVEQPGAANVRTAMAAVPTSQTPANLDAATRSVNTQSGVNPTNRPRKPAASQPLAFPPNATTMIPGTAKQVRQRYDRPESELTLADNGTIYWAGRSCQLMATKPFPNGWGLFVDGSQTSEVEVSWYLRASELSEGVKQHFLRFVPTVDQFPTDKVFKTRWAELREWKKENLSEDGGLRFVVQWATDKYVCARMFTQPQTEDVLGTTAQLEWLLGKDGKGKLQEARDKYSKTVATAGAQFPFNTILGNRSKLWDHKFRIAQSQYGDTARDCYVAISETETQSWAALLLEKYEEDEEDEEDAEEAEKPKQAQRKSAAVNSVSPLPPVTESIEGTEVATRLSMQAGHLPTTTQAAAAINSSATSASRTTSEAAKLSTSNTTGTSLSELRLPQGLPRRSLSRGLSTSNPLGKLPSESPLPQGLPRRSPTPAMTEASSEAGSRENTPAPPQVQKYSIPLSNPTKPTSEHVVVGDSTTLTHLLT